MDLTLTAATAAEIPQIKELYLTAFPKDERAPFGLMARRAKQGKARMLSARNGSGFVGFAYVIENQSCAYLFYLAISPETRGAGCGSAILAILREMYKDKRLFLARETLDPAADNYEQRVRRHNFYLRNGFSDLKSQIREASVVFDVMCTGGEITPDEYNSLMVSWCGKLLGNFMVKFAPVKLFYPTDRKEQS